MLPPTTNLDCGKEANVESENTSRPLWHEGNVDANGEHILLTYGDGAVDNDLPVALVALGPKLTITVQFLITSTAGDDQAGNILAEVRQELDTYLAGEFPLEVWDEAKYHCVVSPNPSSRSIGAIVSIGRKTRMLRQSGTRPNLRPSSGAAGKGTSMSRTEQR